MDTVLVMIPIRVYEIGESVVGPDQFKLNLVAHTHNEILQFRKAKLVPVQLKREFLLQKYWELGQGDTLLMLRQDLNNGLLHCI